MIAQATDSPHTSRILHYNNTLFYIVYIEVKLISMPVDEVLMATKEIYTI
jgi:hypothetical protein